MGRPGFSVHVDDKDPYPVLQPGERRLVFKRTFDAHHSESEVTRMTDDELRATRDAINTHLGEESYDPRYLEVVERA